MKQVTIGLLFLTLIGVRNSYANTFRLEPRLITHKIDTGKVLQTLQIMGVRYPNFFTGSKFNFIDSSVLKYNQQQSLATLLANNSQLFIKSYGPGMLASPSFRGGNANHTAVIWNGFNLQNPMNGQVDFSLVPSFLIDQVAIQYGSAASLFGSGTIGGAVHLQTNQNPTIGFHAEILSGLGSFGTYSGGMKIMLVKKKWAISQKLFWQEAGNNFWFKPIALLEPNTQTIDPKTVPKQRAIHSQFATLAWLQEFWYQMGKYQKVGVKTWLQHTNRNLTPALFSPNTFAKQLDQTGKLLLDYQYKKNQLETQARYAFFKDLIEYSDMNTPASIGISNNHTFSLDQFIFKKKYQIQLSGLAQHLEAKLNQQTQTYTLNKLALFGTLKWFHFQNKLQQQFTIRQEWTQIQAIPLMPAYGIQVNLSKNWILLGNISRSYRLPSFNDLYWPSMGNPSLKPEQGWNSEISISHQYTNKYVQAKSNLTAFSKQIKNWITWVPNGGNLSTPKNIYLVWSRGVEFEWKLKTTLANYSFGAIGLHSLTIASNEESEMPNDASLHQQIIYTPRVKHMLQGYIQYKLTTLMYTYNYVGTRFVSADHSNWLNPFNYSSINLSQELWFKGKTINLQASVNNLFNQTYQVMVNRPMPLINYQLSINIKI